MNAREKRFRQVIRGGNTSKYGDWENIRYLTLNGTEMRFCIRRTKDSFLIDFFVDLWQPGSLPKKERLYVITRV